METKYDVDYFINKFTKIPEKNWISGRLTQKSLFGLQVQHCALGHCGLTDLITSQNEEAGALENLVNQYDGSTFIPSITTINDGLHCKYYQATPKQRVLAFLHDVKKIQGISKPKEVEVIEKERIVYVTVDQEVRELQKQEVVLN